MKGLRASFRWVPCGWYSSRGAPLNAQLRILNLLPLLRVRMLSCMSTGAASVDATSRPVVVEAPHLRRGSTAATGDEPTSMSRVPAASRAHTRACCQGGYALSRTCTWCRSYLYVPQVRACARRDRSRRPELLMHVSGVSRALQLPACSACLLAHLLRHARRRLRLPTGEPTYEIRLCRWRRCTLASMIRRRRLYLWWHRDF